MPRLNAFTGRILVGKALNRVQARVSVTVTLSTNQTNYTLGTAQIPGYVAGITDVTLVINSGVYVYSTNTATPGLTIAALNAADTVTITNNGFILGMGGVGGIGVEAGPAGSGGNGGTALSINRNVTITNNSYIAGGGGGGGGHVGGGGGGAGGGSGGTGVGGAGGAGGGPGATGSNGTISTLKQGTTSGGGGGGRILPGTGGTGRAEGNPALGGGAGGAGGPWIGAGGTGGSAGNAAANLTGQSAAGGGGGGWGASGGLPSNFYVNRGSPGTGGKAVNLNGFTATFLVTGTRYGAIS